MNSRVCAIVPVLNCSTTVGEVVTKTRGLLDFVLVIDDGSKDDSAEIAGSAGALVLRHATNRGKGAALRTGFQRALQEGFAQAITLDADGQHDPDDIPRFLDAVDRFEDALVLGARDLKHDNVPFTSRVGNRTADFFVNLSARQSLPDTQCGYRLYPLGRILRLPLRGAGYEFESEVIVRAARAGIAFRTVPISTHYPGIHERRTHFHLSRDTRRILWCVLRSFFWR